MRNLMTIRLVGMLLLSLGMPELSAQQTTPQFRSVTETSRPSTQVKREYPFDINLRDADGKQVNAANLFSKGKKPTVLFFWLTTCGPCKMELSAIAEKFGAWKKEKDFDFFAISTDFSDRVEQFNTRVKTSNWPFPAYHDFNREFRLVMPGELNGLPQVFVFDASGAIVYHARKYLPGEEDKLWEALKLL